MKKNNNKQYGIMLIKKKNKIKLIRKSNITKLVLVESFILTSGMMGTNFI